MSHSQDRFIIVGLFLFFFAIYLVTYSGRVESGDSLQILDAATSLVNFGDTNLDETQWQRQVRVYNHHVSSPVEAYEANEPLIVYILGIPLWLAKQVQSIGMVHTAWLFNNLILSLSIACFYVYLRQLELERNIAIFSCVLLGLGTIFWVYGKSLFREPLVTFFLLITAINIEVWRKKRLHLHYLLLAGISFLAAYYTKNSSIIALPALLILILPDFKHKYIQRLTIIGLLLGIVSLVCLAFLPITSLFPNNLFTTTAQTALHSYLFSIGGSLWASSPILLLAMIGVVLLLRGNKHHLVLAVFTLVTAYALAHAILTDIHWFGGLSYPPRFLVPVIPFVMLLASPVLRKLFIAKAWGWKIALLALIIFSIGIQVIASISWLDSYVNLLPAEANGLIEWSDGLNQPQYLRWLLLPQSWESVGFDIAWTRTNVPIFMLVFAGIASLSLIAVFLRKWAAWILLGQAVFLSLTLSLALNFLYQNDAHYWANKPELAEILAILQAEASGGEPLFLAGGADVTYERFMMNALRSNFVRPVVLGFQRGEVTSPSDTARYHSDYNIDLFNWDIPRLIDFVANQHERMWWLAHNGVFTPWARRVEERYLSENYYLLEEHTTNDPTVRLLEFSTVRAPNPADFRLPEHLAVIRFGEAIELYGFTLPQGTSYQAGDVVAISYFWQALAPIEQDYTVSWFMVNEAGQYQNLQGIDSMPVNNFAPTSTWDSLGFVIDNRAIDLPQDLPDGTYQIWLRLYRSDSGGTEALPVFNAETIDGTLAILPIRLEIHR